MKKDRETGALRWGYSTGACAAAAARAAWMKLRYGKAPENIWIHFLDGIDRLLPLLPDGAGHMAAIRKNGGDDPDCTHNAVLYADIGNCQPEDARSEDYSLRVGDAIVILRAVEGIGLCARPGLDCDQGRWAINRGPRRMIARNLLAAGMRSGCWLLEIGAPDGQEIARHTLNSHLGILGGISILGITGLVHPYSHEAYIQTVRVCLKSHVLGGGQEAVFCTGGRTRAGARAYLPNLAETAFINIGDFIGESLVAADRLAIRSITVACMPGKLCKYAAGLENTHAHKAGQDMELLRAEARKALPAQNCPHEALDGSNSAREALLVIPAHAREGLLRNLARAALKQFARRCVISGPGLRIILFGFDGTFMLEETLAAAGAPVSCPVFPDHMDLERLAHPEDAVGPFYFMEAGRNV